MASPSELDTGIRCKERALLSSARPATASGAPAASGLGAAGAQEAGPAISRSADRPQLSPRPPPGLWLARDRGHIHTVPHGSWGAEGGLRLLPHNNKEGKTRRVRDRQQEVLPFSLPLSDSSQGTRQGRGQVDFPVHHVPQATEPMEDVSEDLLSGSFACTAAKTKETPLLCTSAALRHGRLPDDTPGPQEEHCSGIRNPRIRAPPAAGRAPCVNTQQHACSPATLDPNPFLDWALVSLIHFLS